MEHHDPVWTPSYELLAAHKHSFSLTGKHEFCLLQQTYTQDSSLFKDKSSLLSSSMMRVYLNP